MNFTDRRVHAILPSCLYVSYTTRKVLCVQRYIVRRVRDHCCREIFVNGVRTFHVAASFKPTKALKTLRLLLLLLLLLSTVIFITTYGKPRMDFFHFVDLHLGRCSSVDTATRYGLRSGDRMPHLSRPARCIAMATQQFFLFNIIVLCTVGLSVPLSTI